MIITTLLLLGSCAGTAYVQRKYTKYIAKKNYNNSYSSRSVLSEASWQELKNYIIKNCKGYFYADALIEEVLKQGHRFTCAQIYSLREIYTKKQEEGGWLGKKVSADQYVNKITDYAHTLKVEAEEKVFTLLNETNETLLLTD